MSSYGEPNVQHKGAVQQIIDARQNALKAVSEVRTHRINTPHPNLSPTDEPTLPVLGTQAVVDYLLQLRPYRASSNNWKVDFGSITLPKKITVEGTVRRGWDGKTGRRLWLCRQPEIPVRNVSDLISALNMNVHYSSNKPAEDALSGVPSGRSPTAGTHNNSTSEGSDYTPAVPRVDNHPGDTPGRDGKMKTYKVVFGPDRLLKLVELADEVAAEVDMLAEIEPPDHSSGGGDAV